MEIRANQTVGRARKEGDNVNMEEIGKLQAENSQLKLEIQKLRRREKGLRNAIQKHRQRAGKKTPVGAVEHVSTQRRREYSYDRQRRTWRQYETYRRDFFMNGVPVGLEHFDTVHAMLLDATKPPEELISLEYRTKWQYTIARWIETPVKPKKPPGKQKIEGWESVSVGAAT